MVGVLLMDAKVMVKAASVRSVLQALRKTSIERLTVVNVGSSVQIPTHVITLVMARSLVGVPNAKSLLALTLINVEVKRPKKRSSTSKRRPHGLKNS